MIARKANAYSFLIIGIISVLIGFFFLIYGATTMRFFILICGCYLLLEGVLQFVFSMIDRESEKKYAKYLMKSLWNIGFGIVMIFVSNAIVISISLLFACYLLVITLTHFVDFCIYRHYRIRGKGIIVIKFLINLIFALLLFRHPGSNVHYLTLVMGCYLILYGITGVTDFLTEIIPRKTKNTIKKNISIQLPILVAAFIPRKLVTSINQLLEVEHSTEKFDYVKRDQLPDIEVVIHLARNGTAAMGHVEVAFEGKVYSYGSYDMHSRTLFDSIGDGVILIADQKKYIEYCVTKKERYLIVFGIALTEKEKKIVKSRIHSLISTNTVDYYPDQALADRGVLEQKEYNDMSSEIYRLADGKFKKITAGKYKKLFVLKTNCVMVAQYILSSVGKEVLAINGILSPGAYYDYLNNRFMMKNTNVISRKIYTKNNFRGK